MERGLSLVNDCETEYEGENILFVSHGDTLQILQTAFENIPCKDHRSINFLHVGEIREITK